MFIWDLLCIKTLRKTCSIYSTLWIGLYGHHSVPVSYQGITEEDNCSRADYCHPATILVVQHHVATDALLAQMVLGKVL